MAIAIEPTDWLTLDITKFEYKVEEDFQKNGFKFEDSFEQPDPGQLQRIPKLIDEADVLNLLRTDESKREAVSSISPEICEYYDVCTNHFYKDHLNLLKEYVAHVGFVQKLDDMNKAGKLLKFFDRQNTSPMNFGKHDCLKGTAAECNASMNTKLAH